MTQWLRFAHAGAIGFGTLQATTVTIHAGEMFGCNQATAKTLALADVDVLAPCVPGKMPALWNNFHQRAAKEGNPLPAHPLYFLKSNNSFCAQGTVIATGIDVAPLCVKALLNGVERQNYPVADMIFAPAQLVSLISHDMTLNAGDIIACGTSVGAGSMQPGSVIAIEIEGVGRLENRYEA